MKTAAIIMAAGASRRLGSPKQLAKVGGERLLEVAIDSCLAAGLAPVLVVLGAHAEQITEACDLREARVINNAAWQSGAASSIHAGVGALHSEYVEAAIVMTCDMPFVTADHLRALIHLSEETQVNVGSRGDNWHGVPACFLRASFSELLELKGDMGARKLLKNAPLVDLANGLDVDTAEDFAAANELITQKG